MNRKTGLFAALALLLVTPYLMAPTGGFPFFPTFGHVTVVNSATNYNPQSMCANGQASGSRCWAFRIGSNADFQIDAASDVGVPAGQVFSIPRSTVVGSTAGIVLPVTTSTSITGFSVGQVATAVKTADTTRTSNATLSNDPDLAFTNVPVGRYEIEYSLQYSLGINAAAGGVQFGGTCTTCTSQIATVIMTGDGVNIAVNPTNGFNNVAAISAVPASTREAIYNSDFTVNVTGTSTVAVLWAQATSGTTGSILRAGSYMKLTRLQ